MRRQSKKISTLLVAIMFLLGASANAQRLVFLYAHGAYAAPLDKNFSNNFTTGLGAEGGAGIGWKKTFIVGTIGYTNFFHKNVALIDSVGPTISPSDLHYIPIKVGLRQYIFMKTIYLHGDVGLGNIKDKYASDTRFSGDIGAGVKFAGFEVQLDYDGFTRKDPSGYASWIGVKAGFNIGL